jgi:hypothetical protein
LPRSPRRIALAPRATPPKGISTKVTIKFDHQGRQGAIIAKKIGIEEKLACGHRQRQGPGALFIAGFEDDFAVAIKGDAVEVFLRPRTGLGVGYRLQLPLEQRLN